MFVLSQNQLPKQLGEKFPNIKQLYVKGDISALELPSVGVIGTRKPTIETKNFIKEKVSELSNNYSIISGLALGCDKIAHEACLENNGITIAVLPCGLDKPYPLMHRKLAKKIIDNGGCIVSEYKPGTKPNKQRFIQRDRITAGLSDKLLVAQCNIKSGTMHTVRFGAQIGIDIMCPSGYPGNDYILNHYYNSKEI